MVPWLSDLQKIGVGLVAFGVFLMFLGILFFFDGGLLAIGNILFLGGLVLVIGFQKTIIFFARKEKIRGTACFFAGILLVFLRLPFWGIVVEAFGVANLFGDFFPVIFGFVKRVPILGDALRSSGIAQRVDRMSGKLPV